LAAGLKLNNSSCFSKSIYFGNMVLGVFVQQSDRLFFMNTTTKLLVNGVKRRTNLHGKQQRSFFCLFYAVTAFLPDTI